MALRGLKGGGYVTYKQMETLGLTDADVNGMSAEELRNIAGKELSEDQKTALNKKSVLSGKFADSDLADISTELTTRILSRPKSAKDLQQRDFELLQTVRQQYIKSNYNDVDKSLKRLGAMPQNPHTPNQYVTTYNVAVKKNDKGNVTTSLDKEWRAAKSAADWKKLKGKSLNEQNARGKAFSAINNRRHDALREYYQSRGETYNP